MSVCFQDVQAKCSRRMEGRRGPVLPRTEQWEIREDFISSGYLGWALRTNSDRWRKQCAKAERLESSSGR